MAYESLKLDEHGTTKPKILKTSAHNYTAVGFNFHYVNCLCFGILQLQFIRHLSTSCNMVKLQSKKQASTSKHQNISTSQSNSYKAKEQEQPKDKVDYDWDDMENGKYQHFDNKDESFTGQNESRLANFVRGWFSYSRLVSVGQKGKSYPSRYSCGALSPLCSFRKIIQLYDGNQYSRIDKSRED
ncbi:hypothetical protein Patl1_12477 [Pistacia atlantica]|uniref:Uncharacterized protein n=1 Tax=Pistacia atlantica TaxID=434234 RepID=A0ACC1AU73_9ROSI|nr:hypothetical protein Patl1_12477 [Pistacia atlantica]